MRNVLFAVLVLPGVMSCFGPAQVEFPSLSEKDRLSFTEEEGGAFPRWTSYKEERYPDAVVRIWEKRRPNDKVMEATKTRCFFPQFTHIEWWNVGTLSVSDESSPFPMGTTNGSITTIGKKIVVFLLSLKRCLPDTQECDELEVEMAVALRERPIELPVGESAWETVKMGDADYQFGDSLIVRNARMLVVTEIKLLALIGRILDIRDGKIVPGQCGAVSVKWDRDGQGWQLYWSNIVRRLAKNDYLAYQSLQPLEDDLIDYQRALNGCYAGAPNNKEAEASQRGREAMSWLLADVEPPVKQ